MLKKMSLAVCVAFVFGVFSPVVSYAAKSYVKKTETGAVHVEKKSTKKGKKDEVYIEEKGVKKVKTMETYQKQKYEFLQKLDSALEKFNKAADNKKEASKKEIKKLVSDNLDKEIKFKKGTITALEEKIAKTKKKIDALESDKANNIDSKVANYISEKGQAKVKKDKEKIEKRITAKKTQNAEKSKKNKQEDDEEDI